MLSRVTAATLVRWPPVKYEIRSSWSSLVQLMACRLAGDRPLFEAVMTKLVGFKKIYIVFDGRQARRLLLFSVLNLFIKMCTLVKPYGQWYGVTLVVHTATKMQICCCWRCYRHQSNTVVSSIRVTGSWVVYWLYCNFKLLKDGFVFFQWTNSHDCIFSDWTSNGSWCMGIKGEMSGTVCVTFTWYMYIYELFIAFVCFVVCSLL